MQADMGMMMSCPMMKGHQDMKAVLKKVLDIQKRSFNASDQEKAAILSEIEGLTAKIDAMPEKMDCPMMKMKQGAPADQPPPSGQQQKQEAKPPAHQH